MALQTALIDLECNALIDGNGNLLVVNDEFVSVFWYLDYFLSFINEFAARIDPIVKRFYSPTGPNENCRPDIYMENSITSSVQPGWWVIISLPVSNVDPQSYLPLFNHPMLRWAILRTVPQQASVVYDYPPVSEEDNIVIPPTWTGGPISFPIYAPPSVQSPVEGLNLDNIVPPLV